MLIRFLVLSFGFAFALRTIKIQIATKPLSEAISTKIIYFSIFYFWAMTILSPWIPVPVLGILLFVPNLAAHRLNWILNRILKHQFRKKLIQFFDELLLLMTTGKSFRDSFLILTSDSHDFFQLKMRELFQCPHDPENQQVTHAREIHEIIELVQVVERAPHKAVERIQNFRRLLKWRHSFRKKSKQATIQVRAQALVLTLLYVALLLFTFLNDRARNPLLVLTSIVLFVSGLILIFILGRQTKWKT